MPERLKNFDKMWDEYPAPGGDAEDAKKIIGGRALSPVIVNTCVLRVSRALNYSGNPIKAGRGSPLKTLRGADRKPYGFRVREFIDYMHDRYGRPDHVHKYRRGGGPVPRAFRGKQGVIVFVVDGWTDATGHADLWDGKKCRHHAYFNKASEVMLWEVGDSEPDQLGGSVGRGGDNARDDVLLVQKLLRKRGLQVGRVDGICGARTIAALTKFQSRFLAEPDGLVEPGGRTWQELNGR